MPIVNQYYTLSPRQFLGAQFRESVLKKDDCVTLKGTEYKVLKVEYDYEASRFLEKEFYHVLVEKM